MPYNDRMFKLLGELDDHELLALWTDALKRSPDHEDFAVGSREYRIVAISRDWRSVHGHSVLNIRRSTHELAWRRILIDVADKLKPGWGWSDFEMSDARSDEDIEAAIRVYLDEHTKTAWEKMSAQDRERMADDLEQQLRRDDVNARGLATGAAARSITVSSLTAGISAGLFAGAGALTLAQGAAGLAVGSLLGSTLTQLGFWIVVRIFGWWSGGQLALTGGAATVAGAVLSIPAAAAVAANAVMSTSYRKSIPALLMVLTAHELRRQISASEKSE